MILDKLLEVRYNPPMFLQCLSAPETPLVPPFRAFCVLRASVANPDLPEPRPARTLAPHKPNAFRALLHTSLHTRGVYPTPQLQTLNEDHHARHQRTTS
jgi:hypothetical protein